MFLIFQWFILAAVTGGIAALARGRGGSPIAFGIATVAAYLAGMVVGPAIGPPVMVFFMPWILVAVVALIARFVLGGGRPKPDGMWSCPDCKMVNESSYIICQACQRPWAAT